jgi:hypothetical protein
MVTSEKALPALVDGVVSEVRGHCGERGFDDDVCLVGMELAETVGRS